MKTCTKCLIGKPFTSFYRRQAGVDGLKPQCIQCANKENAVYRAANLTKIKTVAAAYLAANLDRVKTRTAAYYLAHQPQAKVASAAGIVANPEKCRIYKQNRRAIKAGGKLSPGLAVELFKLQRGKCPCCSQPLGDDYHLDHRMPLKLGGANTDCNIQLLRKRCNSRKGAKHPNDFMREQGFLL